MPENQNTSPVVYEAMNRELKTVKDYFAHIGISVIGIEWEAEIEVGTEITPGQLLAYIVWDGPPKERLEAPVECGGRIEWKNGQIKYEWLHLESQVLLRLAAS